MKTLFISTFLFGSLFYGAESVNSQTIDDSLHNLEIINTEADPTYLSFIPHLYLPKDKVEFQMNPEFIIPTELMLSERYKCNVYFFGYDNAADVNDPIFEVISYKSTYGSLFVHLSALEKLYQKGILYEQVNLYGEYTDRIFNAHMPHDLAEGEPDTMDYKLISEDLFACDCHELPDTFNFGLPLPLDNDFFMIDEFSKFLMKRYGVDQSKYELRIATQVLPETEGILLKDIVIDLTLSQSAIDNGEEYFIEVWFDVPLCAIEKLFRNKGSAGVNEEFRKIIQFGIRQEKKSWERMVRE